MDSYSCSSRNVCTSLNDEYVRMTKDIEKLEESLINCVRKLHLDYDFSMDDIQENFKDLGLDFICEWVFGDNK